MAKIKFAHLHCHSVYSIQDSMASYKDYVNAVYVQNQASDKYEVVGFADTNHGTLYGMVKMYNACLHPLQPEMATKPIYGCEVYHCENHLTEDWSNPNRYHMVLLAATDEGLTNLYKIVSNAGLNIYQGRQKTFPITDLEYIKSHGKGIIGLSACVGGFIPKLLLDGKTDEAINTINVLAEALDAFYLEVQPHDFPEQLLVNEQLVALSKKYGYPLVMTSDSHYISANDRQYHDILKTMSHQKPFTNLAKLYTAEEMEEYCNAHQIPLEAIYNTGKIADMCNVDPKPKNHNGLLPVYPVPEGYTPDTYLEKIAIEGILEKARKNGHTDIKKRLEEAVYELSIICQKGFASYFLILWDWFNWCRKADILTGPGRGSAAGSIISYGLNITKVDPIKYGFFFARFMSEDRDEFPDIDTDIPRNRRADAISYLATKYGEEYVSQIITFGKYKLKNITKAIMSSMGCSFKEANDVTREIPDLVDGSNPVTWELIEEVATNPGDAKFASYSNQEKTSLIKAYDNMQNLFKKYPQVYDGIMNLKECIASTGIHAGGVVVSRHPINEHGALIRSTGAAVLPVLQWDMEDMDFFGFLKIDALGLKTLDIIKKAMELSGLTYDWYDSEDYSDPNIYKMLRDGETVDIFQCSTYMPTKMIKDFNVQNILDLGAVNAGNRPGPLETNPTTGKSLVDQYVECVKTGVPVTFHPKIDPLLKDTWGMPWYQESVMAVAMEMAGYSIGNADKRVRKPLGKKKRKMFPEIKNEYIYGVKSVYDNDGNVIGKSDEPSPYCVGCLARGFTREEGEKMFQIMEDFGKYSFNKSHAVCYVVISYKDAHLSYYYPAEFAVANCTVNEGENIQATLSLARKRKIPIKGPDINHSEDGFSIELIQTPNGQVKCIRYGLRAIKNVGLAAISFINEIRKTMPAGGYKTFDEYYNHVHNSPEAQGIVSKIQATTGKKTPNPLKKDVEEALILSGCFDEIEPNRFKVFNYYMGVVRKDKKFQPYDETKYSRRTKLSLEKDYLGDYISEHPLDPFPYTDVALCNDNETVELAGIVEKASLKTTKKGNDYLTIKIKSKDNLDHTVNVFNETLAVSLKKDIKNNQIVVVKGSLSKQYNNINAKDVKIVAASNQLSTTALTIDDLTTDEPYIDPSMPRSTPELESPSSLFGIAKNLEK